MYKNQPLPLRAQGYDAVLSMGGPMNVYDPAGEHFLVQERLFLRAAAGAGIAILGVCLGAQLLACALGAKVTRAEEKEMGVTEVTLTPAGRQDSLFTGLPGCFPVLAWHEDTFSLPPGASLLASTAVCPHQAFRLGPAYGLQFHLEMDEAMVKAWTAEDDSLQVVLGSYQERAVELARLAEQVGQNFLALMRREESRGGLWE
jgi:GMP synthase-like glutamine amidotransferase